MGTQWNADTELVWDGSALHIFWLMGSELRHRSTTDGVNWTPTHIQTKALDYVSPTIHHHEGIFYMWFVGLTVEGGVFDEGYQRWRHLVMLQTATSPHGPWTTPQDCETMSGAMADSDPWHIGVTRWRDQWVMTAGLGEIGWGGGGRVAVLASSLDGNLWSVADGALLRSEQGTWTERRIYRPSPLVEGGRLRIWFSALGTSGARIGHVEVPASVIPAPPPPHLP